MQFTIERFSTPWSFRRDFQFRRYVQYVLVTLTVDQKATKLEFIQHPKLSLAQNKLQAVRGN